MDPSTILEKFSFYRDGDKDFRTEIEEAVSVARLEAGTHFYNEGDRCGGFAMLSHGRIRVYKLSDTGREITLYVVREGETCVVNILSTILDLPAPAAAVAQSEIEGLVVPAETFRRWVREIPPFRDYVFRTLAQRLVDLMTLVEQVAFQKMDRRLASFLIGRIAQTPLADGTLEATHEQIAADLGCTREVVSRLLEDFERRGGLTLSRGRITIMDPTILTSAAER